MDNTINYYNQNAESYFNNTINVDVSELINKFISNLNNKDHILDIGCGSGRDSSFFIKNGFKVTAIEPSINLANLASKKINQEVLIKKIEDLNIEDKFDGIWAMASLLHIQKENLNTVINNCVKSLKKDKETIFFSTFKIGEGEGLDQNGRFFSYYQEEEIKNIFKKTEFFSDIKFTITKDKLGRDNNWINVFAIKKPALELKKETIPLVSFKI